MLDRKLGGFISANPPAPTQASAQGVWDGNQQIVAQLQNAWPLPPNVVQRSLRFNSADSPSLSRTPGVASNRRTYTWSGWFKLTTLADHVLFNAQANSSSGTQRTMIALASTGYLYANTDNLNTAMIWTVNSNNLLRDFSAWYHIVVAVDTTQATAANRVRMYINGVEVSYAASTYPSQNYDDAINNTVPHYISYEQHPAQATKRLNGYMAEVNFVDGQALTPSSFGETDPQTGIWVPKRYTGTYGTNGFRLPFSNNSSTTALGFDASGNGNNWTPNNFSVTPGSGNDSLLDVPSLYGATDTGIGGEVRGNYCTFNPLVTGATLANGNLDSSTASGTWGDGSGSIGMKAGKWYFEATCTSVTSNQAVVGVTKMSFNGTGESDNFRITYQANGTVSRDGITTSTTGLATWGVGDVIGAALDVDNGTMSFYKNGVLINTTTNAAIQTTEWRFFTRQNGSGFSANFGQRPFAFPAPAGFKALCTTNFVAPAIGQTSTNRAGNHFNVVTYIGDGAASKNITGVGFQPDLVWIKSRTNASGFHILVDAVRGAGKWIATNSAGAESAAGQLVSAFNADGFSLNLNPNNTVNELNGSYVAWCWKANGAGASVAANTVGNSIASVVSANQRSGFSIVTWTGTGVAGTIAHGLGAAPKFIIAKNLSDTNGVSGVVYAASQGRNNFFTITSLAGPTASSGYWGAAEPTSAVFGVGAVSGLNDNTARYVAYCFAEVPGFSSIGSFSHAAAADGTFVYTGFRPEYLLLKATTNSNWMVVDSVRDPTNFVGRELIVNGTSADSSPNSLYSLDFVSNGFKMRNTGLNGTFVYLAIAESPFRLSSAR